MTRERLIELWPVMEHFKNGGSIQNSQGEGFKWVDWPDDVHPDFMAGDWRIKPAPKLVPLNAEDWLKGGPWWVRCDEHDATPCMVVRTGLDSISWCGVQGLVFRQLDDCTDLQRRSASDPEGKWTPCSKPAQE